MLGWLRWFKRLRVNGGYADPDFAEQARQHRPKLVVEVVNRRDLAAGFAVLSRRWLMRHGHSDARHRLERAADGARRHISPTSVRRIWRAHGLKPHRLRSFKLSRDPQFTDKLEAIVGLYLAPPQRTLALCVDGKIQSMNRTQPGLTLRAGHARTRTHDYKWHGTTTLLAALNALEGTVSCQCAPRRRTTTTFPRDDN